MTSLPQKISHFFSTLKELVTSKETILRNSSLISSLEARNDPIGKFLFEEISKLIKSPVMSLDEIGILLDKLSSSFPINEEKIQDAYILKHAQLFILTYCNLNQTASLMQNILADANPVVESMEYWNSREKSYSYFYFLYEKTPLFWYHYFRGQKTHPKKEIHTNLKILKHFEQSSMTVLGNVYLHLGLLKITSLETMFSFNVQLLKSSTAFFYCIEHQTEEEIEFSHVDHTDELFEKTVIVHQKIRNYQTLVRDYWQIAKQKGWISRHWLSLTVGGIALAYAGYQGYYNWEHIKKALIEGKNAAFNFFNIHIKDSLYKMYQTIKYETPSNKEELLHSLEQDEKSLVRMVIDYNKERLALLEQNKLLSPLEIEIKRAQLALDPTDISLIMESYEDEMKKPIFNSIFHDFLRLIFIQVQKQKTDVERLMIQVDQLMKSNELNFQIMALLPASLVVYFIYLAATRQKDLNHKVTKRIQIIFRETHILLNSNYSGPGNEGVNHLKPIEYGRLIVSLCRLQTASEKIESRIMFQSDLREIETENYSIQQRLNTVDRMYRTYRFLQSEYK